MEYTNDIEVADNQCNGLKYHKLNKKKMCFPTNYLTFLLFLLFMPTTICRREDGDTLSAYIPFVRNMHQGIVKNELQVSVPSMRYCTPLAKWEEETETIKTGKKEFYGLRPKSSFSADGSDYQSNHKNAHHGFADQWGSGSPQLRLVRTDSTYSGDHIPVNAETQDLGTAIISDCEKPRNSNSQCRPFNRSTQQKNYVQSAGQFRRPGYSYNRNSQSRPFDTSTSQKVKHFQNAGQFRAPGNSGVPNRQPKPFKPLQNGSSNVYLPGRGLSEEIICWSPQRQFLNSEDWHEDVDETEIDSGSTPSKTTGIVAKASKEQAEKGLRVIYDKVLIIDNASIADAVVSKLTNEYKHLVHACDTEVFLLLELHVTVLTIGYWVNGIIQF